MRLVIGMLAKAWERRRTRRELARLRAELMALDARMKEQPWWGELPPEDRRRRGR